MNRKNTRRIFAAALMMALLTLQGCGNLNVKNNDQKYTPYTDATVIGSITNPLMTHYAQMASCQTGLGTLVADTMWWKTGADFAVVNAGTVRWNPPDPAGDFIPAGNITKGDVARFLPYDNLSGIAPATNPATIVALDLSGAVIKEMLENSFSRMRADGTPGTSYGRFLQVSEHLQVFADVRNAVGSRVTAVNLKTFNPNTTTPIDLTNTTKLYRVAVLKKYIKNSPGYSDYDKYWDILAQGSNVVDSKIYLYDAVVDAFKVYSPFSFWDVSNCSDPNLNLVITHQ